MSYTKHVDVDDEVTGSTLPSDDDLPENVKKPNRFITVEPILIFLIAGFVVHSNVFSQYIFFAVGRQYNLTAPDTKLAYQCNPNVTNDPQNEKDKNITAQIESLSSTWNMYLNGAQNLVSLMVTPFYSAYSDKTGRKPPLIIFCIGFVLRTSGILLSMFMKWPLWVFVAVEAGSSLFGGLGGCFACCMAYIADITTKEQRAMRMALVDFSFGIISVFLTLGLGFWINAQSYIWPYLPSAGFMLLALLYTVFFLPEVRKVKTKFADINVFERLKQSVVVYIKPGRATCCLFFSLMAFAVYNFAAMAGSIATFYEMSLPFCWESEKIGIFNAAGDFVTQFGMMFGVTLLCRWLRPLTVSVIGLTASAGGKILLGTSVNNWMLYGTIPFNFFYMIPSPLLRSYMSQLVHPDEQGALFGGLAIVQVLFGFIAALVLNLVYKSTLHWYSGFVFLMIAGCCVVGSIFLVVVIVADKRFKQREREESKVSIWTAQTDDDERLRTIQND